MQEFDKQLWIERACSRLRRSSRRGVNQERKQLAQAQWLSDITAIQQLEVLVDWCHQKGIRISFEKKEGATYYTAEKRVSVAGRMSPEKQLCMLLHECGHHLIGFVDGDDRFGMGYPHVGDDDVNTTFHHRLSCLEEEMEAWHRGWKLAGRLKLNLQRDVFDRVRLECLRSYVKWANGRARLKVR